MKKFKNKIAVTGSVTLRKAFKDELLELGYEWKASAKDDFEGYAYLKNTWSGNIGLGNTDIAFCNDCTIYNLPEQYEEALKAASEVVEEIPEYVKCTEEFSIPPHTEFFKDKIYKVNLETGYVIKDTGSVSVRCNWDNTSTGQITQFKLSTKEAFDAQNKPKSIIDTLIKGEVYWSNNSFYKEGHLWKFGNIKNPMFIYVDATLHSNLKLFEINCGLNDAQWENLRLATSEERQWLDSCVKAGKYLTKEEALKPVFKVGDWVYDTISCTVQQIKATDHNGADLHIQGWTFCNQLRKATSEEIAEVTKPKLPAQITLTLGTSNIKITVYKDGNVEAEGKSGTIKIVKQLIVQMESTTPFIAGWDSTYTTIKIGCSTFALDELKQIVTAHDKLNELEW